MDIEIERKATFTMKLDQDEMRMLISILKTYRHDVLDKLPSSSLVEQETFVNGIIDTYPDAGGRYEIGF